MTALTAESRRSVALFTSGSMTTEKPKTSFVKREGKDVLMVSDMPVFRSGTFRDSMGFQHTWEDLHITQMVTNHDYLRNSGVFVEVPVRKGHGSFLGDPMDSLIGWHHGLRAESRTSPHDGQEYTYLLADFEIFDPAAQERINNGDWRNRSSEVGFYLTNAEAEFWPVYMGFAYVDIPAVEGLNGFQKAVSPESKFSVMIEKEAVVAAGDNKPDAGGTAGAPGQTTTGQPESQSESSPNVADGGAPAATPAEPAAVPQSTEQSTHSTGNSAGPALKFTIGGREVTDPAAVQQHITVLETFQKETRENAVKAFVTGLSNSNKIAATQVDSLTEFALGLTPEQYSQWSASYESAPSQSLFGQHGATGGDTSGAPQATADAAKQDAIAVQEQIVAQHMRSGMTKEQVKKTGSFQKLTELLGHEPQL